jgi:hypothetical protein
MSGEDAPRPCLENLIVYTRNKNKQTNKLSPTHLTHSVQAHSVTHTYTLSNSLHRFLCDFFCLSSRDILRIHGIPRLGGLRASDTARANALEYALAHSNVGRSITFASAVSYCSLGLPLVLRNVYEWQGNLPPDHI